MRRLVIASGTRFGRWVVVGEAAHRGRARTFSVVCECGATGRVALTDLRSGQSRSCGCLNREVARIASRRHGETVNGKMSAEYRTWRGIWRRCTDTTFIGYRDYGGRGISVCERWALFANFLADMGRRPSRNHSIDRIDNDADYGPDNCRWATRSEQGRNKRSNRLLEARGRTLPLAAWCEETGLKPDTITERIRRGWSVDRALSTPCHRRSRERSSILLPG